MLALKNAVRATSISKQTPDQRAKIDAVIFALWAQGHLGRSIAASVLMIPVSWFMGGLLGLLLVPAALLRHLPEIALAGIFAGLFVYGFEGVGYLDGGPVFILALLMLLNDRALLFLRRLLFDIGDLLTFGALTRRYINRHMTWGPLTIFDDADGLKGHLHTSRILTSGPYEAEIEAFQSLVSRQAGSNWWSELQSEIETYWGKFPVEPNYWQIRIGSEA